MVRAAQERGVGLPKAAQVDFIVAHGVSAYINGQNIRVGSRHFIEEDEGIDCSLDGGKLADLQEGGRVLLYVACEDALIGVIALEDSIRPEAAEVLRQLKQAGIRYIVMLTGDGEHTARTVAAQLPALDSVHWELKPEDKAAIVARLHSAGHTTAFVGDGVNDAPALVSADIGVCLPGGADIARDSAQVILLQDGLHGLVQARLIARRVQDTLKHSFNGAIALNTAFLGLAAGGVLPPFAAALFHNLSTIAVLSYAGLRGRSLPSLPDENAAAGAVLEQEHADQSA